LYLNPVIESHNFFEAIDENIFKSVMYAKTFESGAVITRNGNGVPALARPTYCELQLNPS
jgi:hypothetical protein